MVPLLVARIGDVHCGIPIAHVVEVMRPLPISGGKSVVRGTAIDVVEGAALLGATSASTPSRCVVLRAGDRRIAVLVDEVVGVERVVAQELPTLPQNAAPTADPELAGILAATRVIPRR